jgi:hypothetical protein
MLSGIVHLTYCVIISDSTHTGTNVHGDSGSNIFGEERCLLLQKRIFVIIAFYSHNRSVVQVRFTGVGKKPSPQ